MAENPKDPSEPSKSATDGGGDFGLHMKEAHFPGTAPIDAYGDGGFRFAGMSHRGSLLCVPSGIYGWNVACPTDMTATNYRKILDEAADIEILLVGSGDDLVPITPSLRDLFRSHNISADAMATGAAVRTYNVLLAEGRAVAAALLRVE